LPISSKTYTAQSASSRETVPFHHQRRGRSCALCEQTGAESERSCKPRDYPWLYRRWSFVAVGAATLISVVVILGASDGDDLGHRFEVVARAACGPALIVGGPLLAMSRRRGSIPDGSRGSP
jgi:hypothetical protein